MDISRVDGARNVVLVAPNGPIKISASTHVLSAITNAQIDALPNIPLSLNLPREGVLALSTAPKAGLLQCSEYTISMSGSGHRWTGIMWAPTGLIEINGSDNAGVSGAAIGWAVRLNVSDLTIRANSDLAVGLATPTIVLLK